GQSPASQLVGRARGVSPAQARRGAADGVFERPAARADLRHLVLLAPPAPRVAYRARPVRSGARVVQPQIPVVAADRPLADPGPDPPAGAAAELGAGDP